MKRKQIAIKTMKLEINENQTTWNNLQALSIKYLKMSETIKKIASEVHGWDRDCEVTVKDDKVLLNVVEELAMRLIKNDLCEEVK